MLTWCLSEQDQGLRRTDSDKVLVELWPRCIVTPLFLQKQVRIQLNDRILNVPEQVCDVHLLFPCMGLPPSPLSAVVRTLLGHRVLTPRPPDLPPLPPAQPACPVMIMWSGTHGFHCTRAVVYFRWRGAFNAILMYYSLRLCSSVRSFAFLMASCVWLRTMSEWSHLSCQKWFQMEWPTFTSMLLAFQLCCDYKISVALDI